MIYILDYNKIYKQPILSYIKMIEKTCSHCDKKIEGHTDKQAEYMLNQHILSKHPDKISIKNE